MKKNRESEGGPRHGCFTVEITDFGSKGLKKIAKRNSRIRDEIDRIVKKIAYDPEIGRKLTSDLFGMRTVESADGKYRVIYKLENARRKVVVYAVGLRKHVYDDLARVLERFMPYTGNRCFDK